MDKQNSNTIIYVSVSYFFTLCVGVFVSMSCPMLHRSISTLLVTLISHFIFVIINITEMYNTNNFHYKISNSMSPFLRLTFWAWSLVTVCSSSFTASLRAFRVSWSFEYFFFSCTQKIKRKMWIANWIGKAREIEKNEWKFTSTQQPFSGTGFIIERLIFFSVMHRGS